MILQRLEYNVKELMNSDYAVAVCQAEGERLKSLILLVQGAGYAVLVVETASDVYCVIASSRNQGKLVFDIHKWKRNQGYQFLVKRCSERLLTPQPNLFVLPDGYEVEIFRIYTVASVYAHRTLSGQKPLPAGYRRL